ncbi:hypothetical protein [Micromonospora deserti]|uniref:Uncharacterized protein n=1 Tax=Micromonospora deserti TaxID=2070366 RepID=A0A2W2CV43_9ACTN|nr:hypothetical protein [Micromonospora deserti]PZG02433.1 hypothetical protein C1I99_02315 [Micromonospora deserti]
MTVYLDADRNVEDVSVARDWRGRVGVDGVADALFAAYTAALQAALEIAALHQLPADQDGARTPPALPAGTAAHDEVDEHLWLRRTWRTLRDIDADLERVARRPDVDVERQISSPRGCLTLRVRGGSIVAVTGDAGRIARLDAGQVQVEALSLFQSYALARSPNGS